MIEALNLCKNFDGVEAVKNLSFSVGTCEVLGLLGPNGAGKTTTMRMLTTFLPPSSGTAKVAGYDILKESVEVRRHIGYLPEVPPLYPEFRVVEYLNFVARIKGVPTSQVKSRLSDMIEVCGLDTVVNRVCAQLSKGYRQRVGIAQALIHDPKVIILDEPTSGLDPIQILEIRHLITKLGKLHTVILSTHILQEVAETCSKVLIISDGMVTKGGYLVDLVQDSSLEEAFLSAVAGSADMSIQKQQKVEQGHA